jgi:HupE / UreJ protein
MTTRLMSWLCALVLCMGTGAAWAHKPSDSYLQITVQGSRISGKWDVALRDLDFAIELDRNGDGQITWGEVRAQHADIAAFASAHLALSADGQPCQMTIGAQQVDEHTDGAYTVMPLSFVCPASAQAAGKAPTQLALRYALFADIDPQHRGLLNLTVDGATRTAIFSPQAARQAFVLAETTRWQQFVDYAREGVWHIWIGFDHILFLLSLLLPAVGLWAARRWQPVETFSQAFWDVLRIVTAFTLAHSITLTLAVLGVLTLPSRLVESTIAASVVLAALNNVRPVFHGRRWLVAFGFGLVHGFGFASVLVDLGLPQGALALALLGFNVGVELGQLAIVAVFLPLAFWLRRSWFYRRVVLLAGSLLIAALALAWLVERAFDLKLLPF